MQANVTNVKIPVQFFDTLAAIVNTQVVPAMRAWPGFRGAYWFGDRANGLVRAAVLFEAADQSQASHEHGDEHGLGEPKPFYSQDAALRAVGGHDTSAEEYEVAVIVGLRINPSAQFCRSIVWQEDSQLVEQAIGRIEARIIPGVRQNPGFQGGFWLVNRLSGQCMACTLWDSAEHLEASGEVGRQMRRESIQRGEMQVLDLHQYAILARAQPPNGDQH